MRNGSHRFWLCIAAAVAVAVVAVPAADAASQGQLKCGDTITTDTTLHQDLVNCPTNGIVIGADNVTLDLNGHTIDGDGAVQSCGPQCHFEDFGVWVVAHDGITVKNGSIRQFVEGLDAFGAGHIRLVDLDMSRNHDGGIDLAAADRILVRNCSVNRTTEGAGLLATNGGGPIIGGSRNSHHVRIVNSSFRDNREGITSFGTTDSVIEGNLLSDNGGTGIAWYGKRSRLIHNRVIRDGTGIAVHGSRNVIARNRVSHSSRHGENYGVLVGSGRGNLLAGNIIAGGATSILIAGELDVDPGAVDTVVRGNRLRGASDDGVVVALTAKHTLLRHNSARNAQDDGFDVDDPTTKLSRNRAVRNHDLGIEAVRGVNDGGGNIARHNGDPRQCMRVACS